MALIPFNWNTNNGANRSSGYTVPSDKYGILQGYASNGGSISIDGTTWMSTSSRIVNEALVDTGVTTTEVVLYTCPAGRSQIFDLQFLSSFTAASGGELAIKRDGDLNYRHVIHTIATGSDSQLIQGLRLSGGDELTVKSVGAGTPNAIRVGLAGEFTDGLGDVVQNWIPIEEGQVITFLGNARISVAEFNKYS